MPRSEIESLKPRAIYKLADLFAAVQKEKARLDSQLEGRAEWARQWPPRTMADGLGQIAVQLESWIKQGFTDLEAEAPFSDGQMTAPLENQILIQFQNKRVRPVFSPEI